MKFQLSIVGDGSYLKELKIVKSKKLNKFVKFFKKKIFKIMYVFLF